MTAREMTGLVRRLRDSLAKLAELVAPYEGVTRWDSDLVTARSEAANVLEEADRVLAPKPKKHRWKWLPLSDVGPSRLGQECKDCGLTRIGNIFTHRGRQVDVAIHPETRTPVTPPCEARP